VNSSSRILKWIEPEDNPRNTIYGTLAAGLLLAAENPATETYVRLVAASVVAVATYWVAHGYAQSVGERFRRDGGELRAAPTLVTALRHEWPLAEGASIPLIALVICWAAGAPLATGVHVAVWTAAVTLVVFEVAGGLRRGLRSRALLANAAVGFALGAALLAVKEVLH
jgi:hypothetical protein